ncbi:SprT family zinc-dependent metalloprotease [Cloacibacillus sp.]|uniref:M48 family metallopeptidase n=1 Tax=Cloacibacillus sp. TaxID=2049023 RepID=UPI0025C72DC6|nr:SprT family zinc-dependent metalloprotease [Cloacibacillus sp.]MCC8058457.1 M48 family metallopeptidase [Cloacibacillus sp.]
MLNDEIRTISFSGTNIEYLLKRKPVKNLNLRIHSDCSIVVSASEKIPVDKVDTFVMEKSAYIISSLQRFKRIEEYEMPPKRYISGETFDFLGRGIRLKVQQGTKDNVFSDGIYLYLTVTAQDDYFKKEKLVQKFLDKECCRVFSETIQQLFPMFQKYGVNMPTLRIRTMKTRWGSCSPSRGIITLNKKLLEAPRNCIEYVILHEFCHFIHPNHSKQFYSFVAMLMPDWKERKTQLDKNAVHGL